MKYSSGEDKIPGLATMRFKQGRQLTSLGDDVFVRLKVINKKLKLIE